MVRRKEGKERGENLVHLLEFPGLLVVDNYLPSSNTNLPFTIFSQKKKSSFHNQHWRNVLSTLMLFFSAWNATFVTREKGNVSRIPWLGSQNRWAKLPSFSTKFLISLFHAKRHTCSLSYGQNSIWVGKKYKTQGWCMQLLSSPFSHNLDLASKVSPNVLFRDCN